jgi:hypothetical protein
MVEPPFLGSGLGWDCEPADSDSVFETEEFVVLGAAVSEFFEFAGIESVGAPLVVGAPFVTSVGAGIPAEPVLLELVCALAGKAASAAKKPTMTKLAKLRISRGEPSKLMLCPKLRTLTRQQCTMR